MTPPKYPKWTGSEPCAQTDPEAFYPELGANAQPAKQVCMRGCPMFEECLEWAIWFEPDGIWAGTSPRERREIRRNRGIISTTSQRTAA